MKGGPASDLVVFANNCKEKNLRPFSSYLSLNDVLTKYLKSDDFGAVSLFTLQIHKIENSNETFKHCMREILIRLRTYKTLQLDSIEAMRNEYVVAILHAAINIVMDETKNNNLTMRPQYGVVGEKSKGWVDFTIKVK